MTFEDLTCGLLWLFIFATPFELRFSIGGVSLPGLLGYFSLAAGLLGVIWSNKFVKPSLANMFLLGFCLWSTISIAWSDYPDRAIGKVLIYWGLLGFVALVTQYASTHRIRLRMLSAYVIGCWCGVLSVIYSYLSGTQYKGLSGRYSSAFGDPNFLALALVIGIPVACYLAAYEVERAWKMIFMAYVPAAIAAVIVTGSRGAALALVASSVTFGILAIRKIKLNPAWILAGVAACLVLAYALPPDALARIETIPSELQSGTLSGRRAYWDAGLPLVAGHPIQGLGVGGGDAAVSAVIGIDKVVHSTPLEIVMDGGAVGLLLFYGAILCSLFNVWRSGYAERSVLIAITVAWLIGTFSLSWETHKVTWFIFGLLVSAVPQRRQARSSVAYASSESVRFTNWAEDHEPKASPLNPRVRNVLNYR
jgi:O-antigen ligase